MKSQFKALENLIRFKDQNGDENRGNRRCNDMDTAIPSLMGVPKPILEHVIFCHQEESNWPLGEKLLLKKRFDEIFGSSRYTKALDAIDKQRKEIAKEAKEKAHVLALVGKDRDSAAELCRERDKLQIALNLHKARISDLDKIVDAKERELGEIQKVESEMRDKVLRIESLSREAARMRSGFSGEVSALTDCEKAEKEIQLKISVCESEISECFSTLSGLKGEFESLVRARNEVNMQVRSLRNVQMESSSALDLMRLKQQELCDLVEAAKAGGFLPSEFVFTEEHAIGRMQEIMHAKMAKNESILGEKKNFFSKLKSELSEKEVALAQTQKETFALHAKVHSLATELRETDSRIFAIAGTNVVSEVTDSFLETVQVQLELALDQVDMGLKKIARERRPVFGEDLKTELLEMISDSTNVASLMHASPEDILDHVSGQLSESYRKLEALLSSSPAGGAEEELSLAKQALKIYMQMKSRTLADLKCGLCRHKIESASEFEAVFEKTTRKLPEIISQYESKKSSLGSSRPEEVLKCVAEITGFERTISRINAFREVIGKFTVDPAGCCSSDLELEETALSSERNKILFDMENLKALGEKRGSLQAQLDIVDREISVVKSSEFCSEGVAILKSQMHAAEEEIRSQQMQQESELNALRNSFHLIFQTHSQLESLRAKLATAPQDSGQAQLARLEAEEASVGARLNEVIASMSRVEGEKAEREALLKCAKTKGETAKSRTSFARLSEELAKLKSEIASGLNPNNAAVETIREMSLHIRSVRDERAKLTGESGQMGLQMSDLEKKLNSTTFRDIEEKHRQAFCQLENHNLLSKDVQRYHQALDRALMNYHVAKMNQINELIQDLWGRIYKGTDIDFIAIRSDSEHEEGEGPAKRSYNYRVVMAKGDVELEMRGRCSAGQKVLASLIIRLALAESFCLSCGILALDEPTTNLDRSNIGGLAEALAELIESRRETRNFQLVIITHDESFVRMLGRLRACDHFYRVAKDQFGHSSISRAAIYELNTT